MRSCPLPEPVLERLKDAADAEDDKRVGEVVRDAAEKGYGTQAIIELTKHVEVKRARRRRWSGRERAKEDDG